MAMIEEMHEDPETARTLVSEFTPGTRQEIIRLWGKKKKQMKKEEIPPPKLKQKWRLALLSGIPMVGFGFMDNAVMIVAGDYIDTTLCVGLGLTTLFAAGLGNIVSDVAGVATAAPIEAATRNMGFRGHGMTARQLRLPTVLIYKYIGTGVGVTIGCILGMFPLLWPAEWRLWRSRAEAEESFHSNHEHYQDAEEMWQNAQH
eukprot:TRINITY_DN33566_c0_g1_i1.p1 TRINITY_DN33566_c0_g1~~TRINITY_DN33566_c0_g1_i1.p1  ORF type:complete len:235 (+),score=42.98 TRINITY_DN33566_c0_g1_i1:101-706(+)